jgi:YidC/Oxa1 family membrane protein insertase
VTGLILISALLLVYSLFFAPKPEDLPQTQNTDMAVDSVSGDTQPQITDNEQPFQETEALQPADSVVQQQLQNQFGLFGTVASGEEKVTSIETETLNLEFSNHGGFVRRVMLKDFYTWDKKPLVLLDEESSQFHFLIRAGNRPVALSDLYFKGDFENAKVSGTDTLEVKYVADIMPGKRLVIQYRIPGKGYQIFSSVAFEGLQQDLANENFQIIWNNKLKRLESDLETSRNNSTINYYSENDGFDYLSERSTETEEENLTEKINWSVFKQRFFSVGIIPEQGFDAATFRTDVDPADSSIVKYAQMALSVPRQGNSDEPIDFRLYFGPNNYQILKKITAGFSENVYLGWFIFAWFNKFLIIPVFNFLEQYISNYGIIITILVFFIKILLFPLTYSSYKSFAKQRVLKPELDKLKEKHGEDMQKMQQEQMKLFQQVGINPVSGCIPLLLQMPILLAMFNFFPNSVELRQEGFLWADDLSPYDSILNLPFTIPFYGDHVSLFCLLMTLSTVLYQWSNNQMTGQLQGPMKTVTYLMPVMFMFVLNSFSAGLTYYYFVSNLVTFGQQAIIRKFIDEEKIKKILEENRKKNANKKKSKWQLRVEEAMKTREEQTKKKQAKR